MPLDERSRDAAAGRDAGWPEGCPRPPADVEDLGFERRPMVDWLSPGQLVDTGLKANIGQRLRAVQRYLAGDDVFLANYSDGLCDIPVPQMIDRFLATDAVGAFVAVKPSAPRSSRTSSLRR